ncbi:DUF6227 family protein [Streptomyces sp. NBC_01304]|uniref:DUF6227 family protein n=1 Tax=Streptomyces sp. NBC_01304 TaxID=2903818 RepID=UPI002E1390F8|nr:DUF6227 family protein [Streptomyces sp. NBC_01304]
MSVEYETPEEHLEQLLAHALNSFELPDETLARLGTALAHDRSLRSAHHSGGLHRETYRHTFLLADGETASLWELIHRTTQDGPEQHELYTDEEAARIAAARLPFDIRADVCSAPGPDSEHGPESRPVSGCDPLDALQLIVAPAPTERVYAPANPDDSVDHARRLLRRAENPRGTDRPGEETARLLRSSLAHQITQAFGRPGAVGTAGLGFALYEHAFLLGDGSEISLWEVEHTATPDGRHMCEVYLTEEAARTAMERRADG